MFLSVRSISFHRPDQRMSAARRELARTTGHAPAPRPRQQVFIKLCNVLGRAADAASEALSGGFTTPLEAASEPFNRKPHLMYY